MAAALAACGLLFGDDAIALARRGEAPSFEVAVSGKAPPAVRYAAREIVRYVERSVGVALPVAAGDSHVPECAIVLRPCGPDMAGAIPDALLRALAESVDSPSQDAFRLVARPPCLAIVGASERGALYGAYELLERFAGVRRFAVDCEVVPARGEIAVPGGLDETHAPAFEMREAMWREAASGDFAARLRLNGNSMNFAERHGGRPHRFSPVLKNCHTFDKLVPVDEFFASHPEYFSEVAGLRTKEKTQLCLSNPDVLRIVTERVLGEIRKHPDIRYFGVSQNDWYNPCTCAKCAAVDEEEGSHSGSVVRFVNAVAEAVEKAGYGDRVIETLAYQYTQRPPAKTRCRRNVMPCLCSVECDFSRPLDKSPVEENKAFLRDLEGWSAICEKLYVWDYAVDFMHYLQPFPNLTALRGNLRVFRDSGVSHVLMQGAWNSAESDLAPLKTYLCAKWMWNPDLQPGPMIDEFLSAYYGAAAPLVGDYIVRLQSLVRGPSTRKVGCFEAFSAPYLSDGFLSCARETWAKAAEAVRGDAVRERRVRAAAMGADYVVFRRSVAATGRDYMVTRSPGRFAPTDDARTLASRLLGMADSLGEGFRFSENARRDRQFRKTMKMCVDPAMAPKPCDRVTLPGRELRLFDRSAGVVGVKDPASASVGGGAQVAKLYRSHAGRSTRILADTIGYDADADYAFKVHARLPLTGDEPQGEALRIGVGDLSADGDVVSLVVRGCDVKEGYAWYELPPCRLTDRLFLYVSPGNFDKARYKANPTVECVYVDLIQIVRAE